jgi:hypothetical protein
MLDIHTGATAPALPLQFVSVEITPLSGGQFSVLMQATLLDEEELQFIAEDLVCERVDTLDQALTVIRRNVAALAPACIA